MRDGGGAPGTKGGRALLWVGARRHRLLKALLAQITFRRIMVRVGRHLLLLGTELGVLRGLVPGVCRC